MKKITSLIKEYKSYIITIIIAIVISIVQLPYYIMAPGGTIDLSEKLSTTSENQINGSFNMLYVSEYNATIPSLFLSFILPNWDIEKIEQYQVSDETSEEIYQRNVLMLESSIQNAIFVAYKKASKTIEITNTNNYVIGTTSDNNLKIGDLIKTIDGKTFNNVTEIREYINQKEVGETLQIVIERNQKDKEITTQVYSEDNSKLIGVAILTKYEYKLDPQIELNFSAKESGASGGLMLALNIYDLINDEDLLNGRKIAGTGTIDLEGNIGKIDGIKYKIMGAAKQKVDLVIVPQENYQEAIDVAQEYDYDLNIVAVQTFNQAVNYLKNTR